jgi:hypothetical protein
MGKASRASPSFVQLDRRMVFLDIVDAVAFGLASSGLTRSSLCIRAPAMDQRVHHGCD